ncbi:MAG: Ycf66 family protein [Cyanobacteria bacterium P01_H01_bin.35]
MNFFSLGMLLCGGILIYQGWRLEPILFFAMFLLHIISIFLLVKDFVYHFMSK